MTNDLRFLMRDGKKILQASDSYQWFDIPIYSVFEKSCISCAKTLVLVAPCDQYGFPDHPLTDFCSTCDVGEKENDR